MRDILNIGAGNRIIEGAVNHDLTAHRPEITVVHNLNVLPWPWADESFDVVVAWSVLEHVEIDLLTSMNEIWRLLRPGGEAQVKLPYWAAEAAYEDPTHRRWVAPGTLDALDPDTERGKQYGFYTTRKWKITKCRLNPSKTSVIWTLKVRK